MCTAAMNENVLFGFKDTLAEFTVSFIMCADVFMEEIRPSVETPMEE